MGVVSRRWVWLVGVVSRRWVLLVGVGVASGSGWNLWVWLAGGGYRLNLWVWL